MCDVLCLFVFVGACLNLLVFACDRLYCLPVFVFVRLLAFVCGCLCLVVVCSACLRPFVLACANVCLFGVGCVCWCLCVLASGC